ncbi:IPTL-CTERM sorting domain-containing protein [Usitatibacter palustris]
MQFVRRVTAVPTLSEWAVVLLGLLMLGFACVGPRRQT